MKHMVKTKEQLINEITEIRQLLIQTEQYQNLATHILELLNQAGNRTDLIKDILFLIKAITGFEAVGIRLREGDDFPYYETIGFSKDFVKAERYLCARDQTGEFIRDSEGNPYLECMCGNIICGRTNPSLPFLLKVAASGQIAQLSSLLPQQRKTDRGVLEIAVMERVTNLWHSYLYAMTKKLLGFFN